MMGGGGACAAHALISLKHPDLGRPAGTGGGASPCVPTDREAVAAP
jgi:hypothetical protein